MIQNVFRSMFNKVTDWRPAAIKNGFLFYEYLSRKLSKIQVAFLKCLEYYFKWLLLNVI